MKKKCNSLAKLVISILTVLSLVVTLFPAVVFAEASQYYETILEHNRRFRNVWIDPSCYLEMNDAEFKTLSDQIVHGIDGDYDKVQAIHDWVCENIYYDDESYEKGFRLGLVVYDDESAQRLANMSPYERLIEYKRGVCSYYSAIFLQLVRAQAIPCMTVCGYAENEIGPNNYALIDQENHTVFYSGDNWHADNYNETFVNHSWNEVYVDNQWIIVDTTWDSSNQYRNGRYIKGSVLQSYFDIPEKEFAKDHKIIEYGNDKSTPKSVRNDDIFQTSKGSIMLDTANYSMAPGNQYTIGAFIRDASGRQLTPNEIKQLVSQNKLKVRDSRTGSIVDLEQLSTGHFRITAKRSGTCYIVYEIGGTHASVQIDVHNRGEQQGSAVRNTSYFTTDVFSNG